MKGVEIVVASFVVAIVGVTTKGIALAHMKAALAIAEMGKYVLTAMLKVLVVVAIAAMEVVVEKAVAAAATVVLNNASARSHKP